MIVSKNELSQKEDKSISRWYGANLALLLGQKIEAVYPQFETQKYVQIITSKCEGMSYTQRILLHTATLRQLLPSNYPEAIKILTSILGEENPNETGMFTNFYWVGPIGKFVEDYGLDYFEISIKAIEEITKRNTGEMAIRPFIRKYPEKTMEVMLEWSLSKNFHLRRLASEGCRPKLPWATKLDEFIDNPRPVFKILDNLIEDDIKFVQKSVANNIADYLKVNPKVGFEFIEKYKNSTNKNTVWILKHAMRRVKKDEKLL
ncbi:MAG: DNA alkylation repair protein [bacterium]